MEPSLIEKVVNIEKELSVVIARNAQGETATFPVVEAVFDPVANLVSSLIAPAKISNTQEKEAVELAIKVVEAMEFEGLMAVEMFLDKEGNILVNEIAPRTHNSGHHTIEANRTSQFAQHLRAVCSMPLGSTEKVHNAAGMINLLGSENAYGSPVYTGLADALNITGVNPHLYGKSTVKPHRKMGHVTVTGDNMEEVQSKLLKLLSELRVDVTQKGKLSSMSEKLKVAVLTGGYSGEAVISIRSAATVMDHLDRNLFSPPSFTLMKIVGGWKVNQARRLEKLISQILLGQIV